MKSILYIGNFLGQHQGHYSGPNQWIVESLQLRGYRIFAASDKLNKTARLAHQCRLIWKHRNTAALVLIDTYSTSAFWFAVSASMLCRMLHLKYVLVLHGGNLPQRFRKSEAVVKRIFDRAAKIISPSGYLQKAAVDAGLKRPAIIPNQIVLEKYPFKERTQLSPSLLWVRSLQSIYNPKMALDVVHLLKDKYPDVHLYMVGPDKGNLLPEVTAHIQKKGLGLQVSLTGKLSLEAWTSLAAKCDVFINTTHIDNTPVSVLEAMALGLPVISTEVGGTGFIINNETDGLLVADNDAIAMAVAVQRLVEDNILSKRIILNARTKIIQEYESKVVLSLWEKLLQEFGITIGYPKSEKHESV